MEYLFSGIIWILIAGLPLALIVADIVLIIKKKEVIWFELVAFFIGSVYMMFAYVLWDLPDYDSPLNVYGGASAHAPINFQYIGALALFAVWRFGSYLLLKYSKKSLSPIVESLLLAGTYIGIVLSGIWMIQLWGGANPQGIEKKILLGDETAEGMYTFALDWSDYLMILSGEIAPPPVAYDTHYLCPVSLRGHKKVVRPTRFGLRRGEKIVVNRQLCVANAFEQLIEEKAPRFHHAVRTFYDTYGYPISKHINNAWSADVVYLLMKPLEWIFVFVLYLFDARSEDRINKQYLPKREW